MTIIEFYDKTAIENIAGAMICRPEQVILIGNNKKQMKKSCETYQRILRNNGITTDLKYAVIERDSLSGIVDGLDKLVSGLNECIFDITGGDDLYLVAVGVLMERYKGRVDCHRFNFDSETIVDCDADGDVAVAKSFNISVDDSIAIYGGELVLDAEVGLSTYDWSFDGEFLADVDKLWSICRDDPGGWNSQIAIISRIYDEYCEEGSLHISYDVDRVNREFGKGQRPCYVKEQLLEDLQSYGLIKSLYLGERISFEFKNEQVKRCLTVSGQVLELLIARRLLGISTEQRQPLYNDVRVGAVIRWNDDSVNDGMSIVNEIDVIAMKGAIPVFISCKNGNVTVDELYKLSTVAERFGGTYAKKVLVTSNLARSNSNSAYFKARMEEMGIVHIDNLYGASKHELERVLANVWK